MKKMDKEGKHLTKQINQKNQWKKKQKDKQ